MAEVEQNASFSIPSILALIAAIASFTTGAFWGFILAIGAIFLALLGIILAFSARVRGGVISFVSLVAGVIGIIAAIIKAVLWLAGA